jgi:trimeric autotransporter adhesin
MKKLFTVLSFTAVLSAGTNFVSGQTNIFPASGSAGIGTISPNAKSMLDIESTTAGVLIPRMTTAQRTAIVSPPQGLMVYQTTIPEGLYMYNSSGWVAISPSGFNNDLLPATTGTYNLGSNTFTWENLHLGNGIYHDGSQVIGVSSTSLAFGKNSMDALDAANNIAVGNYALSNITTGNTNIGIGYESLAAATSGSRNTSVGFESLNLLTTGVDNTAIGTQSLNVATSASFNTAIGSNTFLFLTSASYNLAVGSNAGYNNLSGNNNAYSGAFSGYENTIGSHNSGYGYSSLRQNVTGSYNTAIGYYAGSVSNSFTTGTFVGSNAYTTATAVSNLTGIGNNARPTASNQVRIGNSSVTSIGGYAGWTNLSDGRFKTEVIENVVGLDFILQLRPVTYHLNIDKLSDYLGETNQDDSEAAAARKSKQAMVYTGFIAQEVAAAANEVGFDFSGVDYPKNDQDMYGLRYAEFVVPIVKSIQEMFSTSTEQENKIVELNDKIHELEKQNEQLTENIAAINEILSNLSSTEKLEISIQNNNAPVLEQNVPNPFTNATTISCFVPNDTKTAALLIQTATGVTMQEIVLSVKGHNQIQLDAAGLSSGTFSYSLVLDGKIALTKTMIFVK